MKKTIASLIITFLMGVNIFSQGGFKDNFNSGKLTGWYQSGEYGLTVENFQMKATVNKTTKWSGFGVNFAAQDIRTNPILNIKVKTAKPFLLTAYIMGPKGNVNITAPVMAADSFTNICFNYAGMDPGDTILKSAIRIHLAINGSAISWKGDIYFDDVLLGNQATKMANLGGVSNQIFYQGTTGCKVFMRGISNVASFALTGATAFIQNITFDPLAADGSTWMKFDCKAGVNGKAIATLTATGASGYANNSVKFTIDVEANRKPTIDTIIAIQTCKNVEKTIELSGISDGNAAAEQVVKVTASSSNTAVINTVAVDYVAGNRYAKLTFTPIAAGTATITVTVNDQQASNNITTRSFVVTVLNAWNNKPTIDLIPNKQVLNTAGQQTINLTGITDGDAGTQTLTITAVSSLPSVIPNPVVSYTSGNTGTLKYTPAAGKSGVATITLTITDNGGTALNNGNQSTVLAFKIEAYSPPLTGYVIPITGPTPVASDTMMPGVIDYWRVERLGKTQTVSHVKDGADTVFRIACNKKSTFTGSWYYTPDMDLTDYPLLSMWVKCDQTILFHMYFWDDSLRNNQDTHLQYTIPANTWTKVDFDFSDRTGMQTKTGIPLNTKRIKKVLFNYHPAFDWPFTNWSGTVMFKDIRIGDKTSIVPTYYCTINPVGTQTYFKDTNPKTIKLTGISRSKDNLASVSVVGKGTLKNLSVTSVVNGEATISCTPSSTGIDTLTVTVTGAAISGKVPIAKVMKIPVSVIDKATSTPSVLSVTLASTKQIYRGLGAILPSSALIDQYTDGAFGATAVRIGILENQVELVNDNADPNVLDRSKLNYAAFDWNYIRNLKARGVETFILTFWTPPAWMKQNLSTNYQQPLAPKYDATDNKVMKAYFEEYAEDAVAAAIMFKEEADIELTAIGLQNEPAFCEPYGSAILAPAEFAEIIALVGARFSALGIKTKLYFAEQVGVKLSAGPNYSNQLYLDAVNNNVAAKPYSDIFAVHGYASDGVSPGETPGSVDWANSFTAINANGKAREFWMTETGPVCETWDLAFVNAADILTAFESGNVGLWTEWAWDAHCVSKGQPTQKLWAQSMFQYIKPGAKRVVSASGNNDILLTTWKNDVAHGDNLVMVIMNKGNTALTMNISQADLPAEYTVYRCSEEVARFKDGKYTKGEKLLLAPRSIVTIVSGYKATPAMDQVASQLYMNDGLTKSIGLTGITDGNTTNQNPIAITFSQTNSSVISNLAISYTSPAKTGTFTFKPAAIGITEVTMNVTAGGTTSSMKFNIEVKDFAVPNINPVVVAKDYDISSAITLDLTGINDGDDGTQSLTVTAAVTGSTPVGVLGTPVVAYTSPQATGTITLNPLKVGTAEITITVKDNGPAGVNTTTIKVFLVIDNHLKPTIRAIHDTSALVKVMAMIPIKITNGGDADVITSVSAISSDEKVTDVAYVSPQNDYISFFPAAEGTATITLTVTDNGPAGKNTATVSFLVTVFAGGKTNISGAEEEVSVYPNPVSDVLNVSGSEIITVVAIYNMNGELIFQKQITDSPFTIPVEELSSGVYIIKIRSAKGDSEFKIVKN